jgi:uncharacterized protein (TIGR02217 family)
VDTFPTLPGLAWSVHKAPKFATRIQTSISGRELRVLDQINPIWTWTLTYDFLRDGVQWGNNGAGIGTGHDELHTLMGFFLKQQGPFQTWLYDDVTDDSVTAELLAFGDGVTTTFQLFRTLNGFNEPITQPAVITGIYNNGVPVAYSLGAYGVITISPAPAVGHAITGTFLYKWPVRFTDDTADFENFMYQLWSLKTLKFQSVLLP